ncbi:MAG: DNA polymerase Y family protein [Chitinophagaceae bacterium]|nr:MAG: DNA polymerase Y family protein [Chitinophagaceae bacterium]
MEKRYVSIWFHHLRTDGFSVREPALLSQPLVLSTASHGKMMVTACNRIAEAQGIAVGMAVADARAILPGLVVKEDDPLMATRLLRRIAEWCIRFSPIVAIDGQDGLILDASGCTHLWEGDYAYVSAILQRLLNKGYHARGGIADTIGSAWAISRYHRSCFVAEKGLQLETISQLPPAALRLEPETTERLLKLGLTRICDFVAMPPASLRRRFGVSILTRINQALGHEMEFIEPVEPAPEYQERLPCPEPISTATGIGIGLERMLEALCSRLKNESLGLRKAVFRIYRSDGKTQAIETGTSRPTNSVSHLLRLFELKTGTLAPGPGIELFVLDAPVTEPHNAAQEKLWESAEGLEDHRLAALIDRLAGRLGMEQIRRYLPDEHYWPERSIRRAVTLEEKPVAVWKTDRPRPVQLLNVPERIEVTAPIPDYPPMLFRYKGRLHKIKRADGPERIEQEWWIQQGEHRDYYYVEDEEARRYWLFRSGHYNGDQGAEWFIHGFFA